MTQERPGTNTFLDDCARMELVLNYLTKHLRAKLSDLLVDSEERNNRAMNNIACQFLLDLDDYFTATPAEVEEDGGAFLAGFDRILDGDDFDSLYLLIAFSWSHKELEGVFAGNLRARVPEFNLYMLTAKLERAALRDAEKESEAPRIKIFIDDSPPVSRYLPKKAGDNPFLQQLTSTSFY